MEGSYLIQFYEKLNEEGLSILIPENKPNKLEQKVEEVTQIFLRSIYEKNYDTF